MDDFSKWLKEEADKEKEIACKKNKGNCYDCEFEEDCEHKNIINGLDEW